MLPAKNSAYQRFVQPSTERIECDPVRLRTISNTTPLSPLPLHAGEEQVSCGLSFVSDHEDIQRAKQEIVSMVSHDLRSPLTALRVSVGMFLGGAYGDMSPEAQKRLESMGSSVDLLIRMINDLLDLEKFEAGQFRFYVKRTSTNALVKAAIQAVYGMAEAKNITIKTTGKTVKINADSDRIVQVLINLLSNAIKFSPADSIIEVQTSLKNGFAEFRVVDHGKGIAAIHLRHIFNPFVQLNSSPAAERTGSGLGLAISKRIVEAHGGSIGVDSEVGKGSQFWFRLRLTK